MNIFAVDEDPRKAARALCDNHVHKMVLEGAQVLCAAADLAGIEGMPYRTVSRGHPCVRWAGASLDNWEWLCAHAHELGLEYVRRRGKSHKADEVVAWAMAQEFPADRLGLQQFAMCVYPKVGRYVGDRSHAYAADIYRQYYIRKELAWAELARVRAIANVAAGSTPSRNNRPIMVWTSPGVRPVWMSDEVPGWRPTEVQLRIARRWGNGRKFDPRNLTDSEITDLGAIADVSILAA